MTKEVFKSRLCAVRALLGNVVCRSKAQSMPFACMSTEIDRQMKFDSFYFCYLVSTQSQKQCSELRWHLLLCIDGRLISRSSSWCNPFAKPLLFTDAHNTSANSRETVLLCESILGNNFPFRVLKCLTYTSRSNIHPICSMLGRHMFGIIAISTCKIRIVA